MRTIVISSRGYTKACLAALLLGGGLCLPSVSTAASSGGAGLGPPSAPAPGSADVQPGNATVMVSGDGITVTTKASAQLSQALRFTGRVPAIAAGHAVEIERSAQTGGSWTPTVGATVGAGGTFTAVWHANETGRFAIRAVIGGSTRAAHARGRKGAAHARGRKGTAHARGRKGAAQAASAGSASPTFAVTIYRPAIATFYGPGFYGRRTACGKVLTPHALGVANRTLRCGTQVAIYYQGRMLVVPVIDRGPYANGADWDLTESTATALGIHGTVTIGAVSLP